MINKKVILSLTLVLSLGACASNEGGTNSLLGTLLGAGLGGLAGSHFGSGTGQLIGVGLGTLAGAAIGNSVGGSMDDTEKLKRERNNRVDSCKPVSDAGRSRFICPDGNGNWRLVE